MKLSNPLHHVRQHGNTFAGVLLLTLGVLFFHWRGIQPGHVFLPVDLANRLLPWREGNVGRLQNWLISDPLYQFYPFLIQTVHSMRSGQLLLWNPALFSGHPSLGDPLFQTFYPFVTAFALLFGPPRGFSLALVAHVLLAALLMFGFLRILRLGLPAAVLGGFTYALSGYMVTWFEFPFWITTLAWLPGILWAYQVGVERQQWRYTAVAGLLLGLALLAGQYQFLVVFTLFWSAYAVASAVGQRRTGGSMAFALLSLPVAILLGLLIGAVQALPFVELLGASRRALGGGQDALPISQLVTILLPSFYGNPHLPEDYWGYGNYNEHTLYVGIVATFLAWLAFYARPRSWTVLLAAAVFVIAWFAVKGPGTEVALVLPIVQQLSPHRVIFLLPLLVGWLAAHTLDRPVLGWRVVWGGLASFLLLGALAVIFTWNDRTAAASELFQRNLWLSITWVAAGAALLLLRERRVAVRTECDWLIVGLVFINLIWFGRSYNPAGPLDQLFPPTPVTEYLRQSQDVRRAVPLQHGNTLLFGPNAITDYGVLQPGGYSSLVIAAYHDLISRGDPVIDLPWIDRSSNFVLFSRPSDRLLDLLNVNLLVAPEEVPDSGPVAEFVDGTCSGPGLVVNDVQPLRGEFTAWRSAINRIDIPLVNVVGANSAPLEGTTVRLRLWRDGEELAVDASAALADVLQKPQWTVYFAPEEKAPGHRYAWEITTEGLDGDQLRVCATAGGSPALSAYGPTLAAVELAPDNGVRLYRRYTYLPRAAVVYAAETVADAAARLDRLLDPGFDVRNVALTEAPIGLPAEAPQPASPAEIVHYSNQRVVIEATAQRAGLLVLADQYFEGWEVTVDGQSAPVLRVNHFMRGVPLSAGAHRVEFTFAPRSLTLGGALSLLGLVLVGTIFFWNPRPGFWQHRPR